MLSADWKTQTRAPGCRCRQCSGHYAASDVTLEREGPLDDPNYIEGLAPDHYLRARQNVFSFSMNVAAVADPRPHAATPMRVRAHVFG